MNNLEYYQNPPHDIVQMAVCPGCGQEHPLATIEFFGLCTECLWLECDLSELDDPRIDNPKQPCLMDSEVLA
jgi:hypothetical protein